MALLNKDLEEIQQGPEGLNRSDNSLKYLEDIYMNEKNISGC